METRLPSGGFSPLSHEGEGFGRTHRGPETPGTGRTPRPPRPHPLKRQVPERSDAPLPPPHYVLMPTGRLGSLRAVAAASADGAPSSEAQSCAAWHMSHGFITTPREPRARGAWPVRTRGCCRGYAGSAGSAPEPGCEPSRS